MARLMTLKTRIILIVVIPIIGLSIFTSWLINRQLRNDLRELVATQQSASATFVASSIDASLEATQRIITDDAYHLPPAYFNNTNKAQRWLEDEHALQTSFDDLLIINKNGIIIADFPPVPGRRGSTRNNTDWYQSTLRKRTTQISDPYIGEHLKEPMVTFSAPVIGTDNTIDGMLVGVLRLRRAEVLGEINRARIGKTGRTHLLDRRGRYITHPNPAQILDNAPIISAVTPFGHALTNVERTIEAPDETGEPNLITFKHLNATDWTLVTVLPANEAYASIKQVQMMNFTGTGALLLISLPLVWLLTRRTIRPLAELHQAMQTAQTHGFVGMDPLKVSGHHELSDLAQRFNTMVSTITERDQSLRENEQQLGEITAVLGFGVFVTDNSGHITFCNPATEDLLQWRRDEVLGRNAHNLFHPHRIDGSPYPASDGAVQKVLTGGKYIHVDKEWMIRRNGKPIPVEIHATPLIKHNQPAGAVIAFTNISERLWIEERLRRQATCDPLTGLPNRRTLFDRLAQTIQQSRREQRSFALIMLDLDGFKPVNDSLGHAAGDELLCQLGIRINALIRASDTFARLGGDEFALLLPGQDNADATQMAQKILDKVALPFPLTSGAAKIGTSLGIAIYPENGEQPEQLLAAADAALYASKLAGKRCFRQATQLPPGADRTHPTWETNIELGDPALDSVHRNLLERLDCLEQAILLKEDKETLQMHYDGLLAALREDFSAEEEMIDANADSHAAYHFAAHQALLTALVTARENIGQSGLSTHAIRVMLIEHIHDDDAAIVNRHSRTKRPKTPTPNPNSFHNDPSI